MRVAHAPGGGTRFDLPLLPHSSQNVLSSHNHVRRLFAPELHVSIRSVTFKLDVLDFHRHVVEQDARLFLEVPFYGLLDRGFRLNLAGCTAAAQNQCRAHKAQ
jgi:hypothetical protein